MTKSDKKSSDRKKSEDLTSSIKMKRLGKVFAVIGGARDVGAAIVRELGKKIVQGGERGIVHFTSRPENMYCAKIFEEKLRREFCNNSVTFRASELDIGSRWSIENFQRKFKKRHGYLDIVINNAAVYRPPDEVSNISALLNE